MDVIEVILLNRRVSFNGFTFKSIQIFMGVNLFLIKHANVQFLEKRKAAVRNIPSVQNLH